MVSRMDIPSVVSHPAVVQEFLEKECSLGRMVGPLPTDSTPGLQISPFGVIPKGHTPGKWRLIVDLSHPEGRSVNDGISKERSSLAYVSVDHIVQVILRLGRGTQMAKIDIRSAYRVIPVHPEDSLLLGMRLGAWEYITVYSHSGWGQHQKFLIQWQMPSSGWWESEGPDGCFITLLFIFCVSAHQGQRSAI